jgi:hypothetical protein
MMYLLSVTVCTLRLRSKGAAVATVSNWLFNFVSLNVYPFFRRSNKIQTQVIVQITPRAIQNLGWRTYLSADF